MATLAAGHGLRGTTHEELRYLKDSHVLGDATSKGLLILVDVAIGACGKAGVAAPVLAALAGIPWLQPYTPPLRQAQPLLPPSPGHQQAQQRRAAERAGAAPPL